MERRRRPAGRRCSPGTTPAGTTRSSSAATRPRRPPGSSPSTPSSRSTRWRPASSTSRRASTPSGPALLVSYAALLLAIPLLVEEARERFGEKKARDALPFLFLYPVGFFLAAVYTESLFLLVALLAFRSVRRGNSLSPSRFGLLLGLTRAPAAAVGPALALSWWLGRGRTTRGARGGGAPLLRPARRSPRLDLRDSGSAKGEPRLFFRSMGGLAPRGGRPRRRGVVAFFREFAGMLASGWFVEHPGAIAPFFHFVLFALLGAVQLVLRRWPDAAWIACALALPVLTGTATGLPATR